MIYPLSEKHNTADAHSNSLFEPGDDSPIFIVDGIELAGFEDDNFDLVKVENQFIERLQKVVTEQLAV